MNKQVYTFHETGVIPGIPREFHAGLRVEVDLDTLEVLEVRSIDEPEKATKQPSAPQDEVPPKKKASAAETVEGV